MTALVVSEHNGKYELISGHRRLAAIKSLIADRCRRSGKVPCFIKGEKPNTEADIYQVDNLTGIIDEFSFEDGRSIINCAEVWGAREHILAGGKFDELFIATRRYKPGSEFGTLFPPCNNCEHTFKDILSQLERTQ